MDQEIFDKIVSSVISLTETECAVLLEAPLPQEVIKKLISLKAFYKPEKKSNKAIIASMKGNTMTKEIISTVFGTEVSDELFEKLKEKAPGNQKPTTETRQEEEKEPVQKKQNQTEEPNMKFTQKERKEELHQKPQQKCRSFKPQYSEQDEDYIPPDSNQDPPPPPEKKGIFKIGRLSNKEQQEEMPYQRDREGPRAFREREGRLFRDNFQREDRGFGRRYQQSEQNEFDDEERYYEDLEVRDAPPQRYFERSFRGQGYQENRQGFPENRQRYGHDPRFGYYDNQENIPPPQIEEEQDDAIKITPASEEPSLGGNAPLPKKNLAWGVNKNDVTLTEEGKPNIEENKSSVKETEPTPSSVEEKKYEMKTDKEFEIVEDGTELILLTKNSFVSTNLKKAVIKALENTKETSNINDLELAPREITAVKFVIVE